MTVLLAGGTGYIGSHTAVYLIEKGYDVIIADNLYNSDASVIDTIEKITGKRPRFYEADLSCSMRAETVFKSEKIDAVINFAGYKAVGESCAKPLMYYRNNLDITLTLLELMGKYGCKRFIFSSSATVYGEKNQTPYNENMPAGRGTNPYSSSKYIQEVILEDAAKADGELSVVNLRYFNPIGAHKSGLLLEQPKGVPGNLMPFIAQVAAGKRSRLEVFGDDYDTEDGTGVRDYIHVMDLASGHEKALEYAMTHTGCEAVNLGTGRGTSVLEVVAAFERASGVRIPYVVTARRPGDVAVSCADAGRAKELFGWEVEYTVEDACRDTWNAVRMQNSAKE